MSEQTRPSPLRSDLQVVEQERSGRPYFVIKNPTDGRVLGFSASAYRVLQSLDGKTSLAELVGRFSGGDSAAGREAAETAVTRFVEQARGAGLLEGEDARAGEAAEAVDLVMGRSKKFNPFFFKFAIIDPTVWLRPFEAVLTPLFSKLGLTVLILALAGAGTLIGTDWPRFWSSFRIFAFFQGWIAVYVLLAATTAIHETGHVMACRRYGGSVKEAGLALYLFQPAAFANISDVWLFAQKWQRVAVALGGIYFEAFIWCAAIGIWYWTIPFSMVNQIAFVLSVVVATRIVINLLPLLRLDGYWVLSDLLGIRNLRPRSFAFLLALLPVVGARWRSDGKPKPVERIVLTVYGLSSAVLLFLALKVGVERLWSFLTGRFGASGNMIFWVVVIALGPMLLMTVFRYLQGLSATRNRVGTGPVTARQPLVVEGLRIEFDGFALQDVSFRVEPGRVTGFLGHNGAGKTTTLKLIMGMLRKDGGSARIGAFDHRDDEKRFKQQLGFVPEEGNLYAKMTVRQLLDFVAEFYDRWDTAFCDDLLRRFDLPPDRKLGKLSKGMRMKVNLVVALGHDPPVLVLDEPTSGLDPRSRVVVLDLLRERARNGCAVFFSTHNLHEVERIADRVIVIDNGRILVDDDLEALRGRAAGGGEWSLESFFLELTP